MKSLISILTVIFLTTICLGQNHFQINSIVRGETEVKVNRTFYKLDSTFTKVRTNYPKFDTLVYVSNRSNEEQLIICNFKPDSSYTIDYACCGSIDIFPSHKANNDSLRMWLSDFEKHFSEIQLALMDRPSFTLKLINNSIEDSIYGMYVDYACFPKFKLLGENG